jgi:hypothetical protein
MQRAPLRKRTRSTGAILRSEPSPRRPFASVQCSLRRDMAVSRRVSEPSSAPASAATCAREGAARWGRAKAGRKGERAGEPEERRGPSCRTMVVLVDLVQPRFIRAPGRTCARAGGSAVGSRASGAPRVGARGMSSRGVGDVRCGQGRGSGTWCVRVRAARRLVRAGGARWLNVFSRVARASCCLNAT